MATRGAALAADLSVRPLSCGMMGYVIQAIIATPDALARTLVKERTVALTPSLALLPLAEGIRKALGVPFCPLTDEGAPPVVPPAVLDLLRTSSVGGRAAYVEAEIFGGAGLQACVLAADGVAQEPEVGGAAINVALRFLGVQKRRAMDEFEAIGLGRHAHTEEWITSGA